jgi:hypothetical protein
MRTNLGKQEYFKHFRKERKQVVILLGAGAAIPWGGIKSCKIKKIITQDKTFKVKDGRTMGQFIFDTLDKFYGDGDGSFETAMAAIEEVLNYTFAITESITVGHTSFIPSIMDLKKDIDNILSNILENKDDYYDDCCNNETEKEAIKKRKCCYEIFRHYINLIIEEINKYNKKVDEYDELNKNLIQFTKYFLDRNYTVKFYTLNYDSLIPQILSKRFKIYEGMYKIKTNSGYSRFIYNLNSFRRARLSHFNLHGSIFLCNDENNRYETVYSSNKELLSEDGARGIDHGNPGEPLFFSPIVFGHNKTQRSFNKPFNLGFNAFINDYNDCRALITVGYSFSDPHINSILSGFTSWNKAKFLDVTYENKDKPKLFQNEYTRLTTSVTSFYKKEDKDKTDTWLCDINERKRIYKKGFEDFLKDKSNWAWLIYEH